MSNIDIDIDQITTDGYFDKNSLTPGDAHLRLAALVGIQPVSFELVDSEYVATYESFDTDVDKVVTGSNGSRWLWVEVHRPNQPVLRWEDQDEYVLRIARHWIGIKSEPNWDLVSETLPEPQESL